MSLAAQGVLAFWGLTEKQEREVIRNIVTPCMLDPLPQVGRAVLGNSILEEGGTRVVAASGL